MKMELKHNERVVRDKRTKYPDVLKKVFYQINAVDTLSFTFEWSRNWQRNGTSWNKNETEYVDIYNTNLISGKIRYYLNQLYLESFELKLQIC